MNNLAAIDEELFELTATSAVQSVFKTMLGQTARLLEAKINPTDVPTEDSQIHVIGTAGLVGSISGLIYLDLDLHFANRCAARLLGMSSAEIDAAGEETVNDAIGELTNMTLGAFKNQLCDRGFPCKLTIPSVIRGQQFVATPVMGATRRTYHFELNGHRVVADILIGQAD